MKVVIDTNVFVAAMRSGGGASRDVLRKSITGPLQPIFGNALWLEYLDVLGRDGWGGQSTPQERREVLSALALRGQWITIYYNWRPNLPDEGDNHLIELALAGGADVIITHNVRDIRAGELHFQGLRIVTPREMLEEMK